MFHRKKLSVVLRSLMGLVIYTVKFLRSNLSFIFGILL